MTIQSSLDMAAACTGECIPVAVIIPVCDEQECIGEVVGGFQDAVVGQWGGVVAVGLNGTRDRSGAEASAAGALVGEVAQRGYGHGCLAAIQAVKQGGLVPEAYLFAAGDGANSPADLEAIWRFYRSADQRLDMVLGERTWFWRAEGRGRVLSRIAPNILLGLWASLLGGRCYLDLAPLRILSRDLFVALELEDHAWGWTIEAQVKAARLGARIGRLPISESSRMAGEQKVSGRGLAASLGIGAAIALAGLRARCRAQQLVDARAADER